MYKPPQAVRGVAAAERFGRILAVLDGGKLGVRTRRGMFGNGSHSNVVHRAPKFPQGRRDIEWRIIFHEGYIPGSGGDPPSYS